MFRLRRIFAAIALALVVAPLAAHVPLFDPDIDQRLSHADDGEGDDGDAMAEMSR